jgi:hypothetical protein
MSPLSIYIVVISVFTIVIGYDVYDWMKGRTFTTPELRLQRFRKKINISILLVGCICLGAATLFEINLLRYRSPMVFSDIDSITLRDFTGFCPPTYTLDGDSEFAFITTSIEFCISDSQVEVNALFHPSRSYVFNENIPDRLLLTHELYHFRITELAARNVRKELSMLKKTPTKSEIQQIINDQQIQEHEMQAQYDDESYHGYILKNQKGWQTKVDSLLSLLDNFRAPSIQYYNR